MLKNITLLLLCSFFIFTSADARVWHVSTEGTSKGNGTRMFPWDIKTGLKDNRKRGGATRPSPVQPGDTIAMHEGIYKANIWGQIYGAEGKPVVIMPYNYGKVVLDANTGDPDRDKNYGLRLTGEYVIVQGLHFTNSSENRITDEEGSKGDKINARTGLFIYSKESKVINCKFYNNVGSALLSANEAHNLLIYGCIFFYNGWEAPDRGHGHAMYLRNDDKSKPKVIEANIFHNSFGRQISGYGDIEGFIVKDNISFYAGLASQHGAEGNVFFGGSGQSKKIDDLYITDNIIYAHAGRSFEIGYIEKHKKSVYIKNNYVIGGNGLDMKPGFEKAELENNRASIDDHIKIIPNRYEEGRATVAVMNKAGLNECTIDFKDLLVDGDAFEVVDVQDYFGEPVYTGVYEGKSIAIPLNSEKTGSIPGKTLSQIKHTPKEFNVFIVRKARGDMAEASR